MKSECIVIRMTSDSRVTVTVVGEPIMIRRSFLVSVLSSLGLGWVLSKGNSAENNYDIRNDAIDFLSTDPELLPFRTLVIEFNKTRSISRDGKVSIITKGKFVSEEFKDVSSIGTVWEILKCTPNFKRINFSATVDKTHPLGFHVLTWNSTDIEVISKVELK